MTETRPHNGQMPTDPLHLAVLLLATAAVIGRLSPEQTQDLIDTANTVITLLSFPTFVTAFLTRLRRGRR